MASQTAQDPVTSVTTVVAKDWSWLVAHLFAITLVVGLVIGGVYLVEDLVAKHDAAKDAKYESVLTAQEQSTKDIMQQFQASEAQNTQLATQLLAQNKQLQQEVATRDQQLVTQVKTDATLSAEQTASRLADQISVAPSEVVAQNNNVILDLPAARDVTTNLDRLPVAQADLVATQKQLDTQNQLTQNAQSDLTKANGVITSQQTLLATADKACDLKVTAAKAAGRKSGIKGFFIGVATVLVAVAGHSI